jgi:DNA polymerase V
MGVPWFHLEALAKQHRIIPFSSNYALYADMSNRVMRLLSTFSPSQEVYSIDECFLDLTSFTHFDLVAYGQSIRETILRHVGLPVCVGIANTKTLAKLANHVAKRRSAYQGVCDFTRMAQDDLDHILAGIEVSEVWGVGPRITPLLADMGIVTVLELKQAPASRIRQQFSVVLERTVAELNGEACIEIEEVAANKQQIMSSRSFGAPVYDLEELQQSVASYTSRAAEKLRGQHSLAGAIHVYIRTNPFKADVPQYSQGVTFPLGMATSDTRQLVRAALAGLKQIYRPGFAYAKSGIMLMNLIPAHHRVPSLFDDVPRMQRSDSLMKVMDRINRDFGRGTIRLLGEGVEQAWRMRSNRKSPCYTTRISEIPLARA